MRLLSTLAMMSAMMVWQGTTTTENFREFSSAVRAYSSVKSRR